MDYAGLFKTILPQLQIGGTTQPLPKSNIDASSPLGQIVGKLGGYLKPYESFMKNNPYEQFADPYRKVASTFVTQNLRPEFETYNINPFRANYRGSLAATGAGQMGGARTAFQQALRKVEMPYYEQLGQVQSQIEDFARKAYEAQLKKAYTSPIAGTNLGT